MSRRARTDAERSPARVAVLRVLTGFAKGRIPRVRDALEAERLPPREFAFAFELVHGVLRRERLLDFALAQLAHRGLPKDPLLRVALRMGAQQLLFLRGVPAHAAVDTTVGLLRDNRGFVNAVLRGVTDLLAARAADPAQPRTEVALMADRCLVLPPPGLPADPVRRLAIVHSLPDFLAARFGGEHGLSGLEQIAAAASALPVVFLRVAGDRDPDEVAAALAKEQVTAVATGHPRILAWTEGASPFASAAFREGWFTVQDPTALRAAEAVDAAPGMTIVDLCAAPGTKAMVLAERVRPGGCVFAFDQDPVRRLRIGENAARLGLSELIRVVGDAAALPPADAVLVDVPCSNTGVLSRRIEVRSRLAPGTFAELAVAQRALLEQALQLARPGGRVVYSTCSIDRTENQDLVQAVSRGGFLLDREQLTLPRAGECDGGYFAVLRRT